MKILQNRKNSARCVALSLATLGFAALAPVQAEEHGHTSVPDTQSIQSVWKDAGEGLRELDSVIAAKKLAQVHETAFNLRDSVRELRSVSASLPADSQAKLHELISKVDKLANDLDTTGDRNDLRNTIVNQRRMHVLLDSIAALYPGGTLKTFGPVKGTGPVKDPVCRMTVDPATAPGKAVHAGQTYYFCSVSEVSAFQKKPAHFAALYDETTFGKARKFNLGLTTGGRARAGQPLVLDFVVREAGKSATVKEFQLVHEKLMHLIVVSDDLNHFWHEHPQIGRDGRFRLKWTFPRAGRYWLYADFTPADGLNQVLRASLTVDGAKGKPLPRLRPDKTLTKNVDGYSISVRPSAPLQTGKASLLTYTISQNGRPVNDMQPYLGAMGHMMAIHQNGRDIVHTHTVAAGGPVQEAMATSRGPRFTFDLTLPRAGVYKIWAQFQRQGHVITVPFVFAVRGDIMIQPRKTRLAAAALGTGALMLAGCGVHAAPAKKTAASVQKVTITLPDGYKTGAATLKAGRPVALTFYLRSDAACGNTVSLPATKWTKTLKVGEKATVKFTPKKSGPLAFSCGMDMHKGTIIVK